VPPCFFFKNDYKSKNDSKSWPQGKPKVKNLPGYWGGDHGEEPVTHHIGGSISGVFPYGREQI
jgi:hypothetical protein